jgi:hypothetical protein
VGRSDLHHALRLLRLQAVELTGVAVGHQHMDASFNRAVHDRLERRGGDPVLLIEGSDENAGNAVECIA